MRKSSPFLVSLMAAGMITAGASGVMAKTVVKVQTAMAAGSFTLNYLQKNWVKKVEEMTGGEVTLEILPGSSVVPHREVMNAVSAGILQGDLNAVAYYAGRDAAFGLMGDLIAGYDSVDQFQMFCRFGGGREVLQKLYDKHAGGKIHVVGCGPFSKEGLVAGKPIRTVEDFKGVKIRSPEGMAAAVFKAVGAAPTAIPFPETYTAVEKGIVDAADASSYTNNDSLGFHKIAKYPIFPGIHSMAVLEFTINKDTWKKLGPQGQAALETWYYAAWTDMSRASDVEDRRLAARDRAGKGPAGIEVIDWSFEERTKFRTIAQGVWKEFAKRSPLAQEAYDAHIKFMTDYGLLK